MFRSLHRIASVNKLFPNNGRKSSFWDHVNIFKNMPHPDAENYILFNQNYSRGNFQVSIHSDKEYGGGSVSEYGYVEDENGDDKDVLHWSGTYNFTEAHSKKSKSDPIDFRRGKKGFCALNIKYPKYHDLRDFNAFKLVMRSEFTQKITFNVDCERFTENGELYQKRLQISGGDQWVTAYVPFDLLELTMGGTELENQRECDSLRIGGVGFLLIEPSESGETWCVTLCYAYCSVYICSIVFIVNFGHSYDTTVTMFSCLNMYFI
jgi:hypothetical protein